MLIELELTWQSKSEAEIPRGRGFEQPKWGYEELLWNAFLPVSADSIPSAA